MGARPESFPASRPTREPRICRAFCDVGRRINGSDSESVSRLQVFGGTRTQLRGSRGNGNVETGRSFELARIEVIQIDSFDIRVVTLSAEAEANRSQTKDNVGHSNFKDQRPKYRIFSWGRRGFFSKKRQIFVRQISIHRGKFSRDFSKSGKPPLAYLGARHLLVRLRRGQAICRLAQLARLLIRNGAGRGERARISGRFAELTLRGCCLSPNRRSLLFGLACSVLYVALSLVFWRVD